MNMILSIKKAVIMRVFDHQATLSIKFVVFQAIVMVLIYLSECEAAGPHY